MTWVCRYPVLMPTIEKARHCGPGRAENDEVLREQKNGIERAADLKADGGSA